MCFKLISRWSLLNTYRIVTDGHVLDPPPFPHTAVYTRRSCSKEQWRARESERERARARTGQESRDERGNENEGNERERRRTEEERIRNRIATIILQ